MKTGCSSIWQGNRALEAVLGATRPPEMKLPIKWPNAPTGDIVIELQETVFAKRVEIWHFLMVQLVRGLLVQMIAMVMVSAKVWKNLQKITFHLIYMKILLLNTIVHGMLNTVTDVNVTMVSVVQIVLKSNVHQLMMLLVAMVTPKAVIALAVVNVITVLVYVNVSQDIMVMHVKHKQH